MAELYDWEKENRAKQLFNATSSISSAEYTFNVKIIERPGKNKDKLIVKGVILPSDKYKKLKTASPRKHKLAGSISTAINNALNVIAPKRTQRLGEHILLKPESDGRLYFTFNGLKYYIDKTKTRCIDEGGNLWMLDLAANTMYGGCEATPDFDYAFVSYELERAYYNGLEDSESWNVFDSLFTQPSKPASTSKVVDFEAYKNESTRGR